MGFFIQGMGEITDIEIEGYEEEDQGWVKKGEQLKCISKKKLVLFLLIPFLPPK